MNDKNITLIGAGNIAKAIVTGLVADGYDRTKITACDPDEEQLQNFTETGITLCRSNQEGVSKADVIVFCVKPGLVEAVCQDISNILSENQLVISVAAGIQIKSIRSWVNTKVSIIRCMPNTPALVRQGMTVMHGSTDIQPSDRNMAERILKSVGECLWIEEEAQIDAVTAVSGSGPAYFFLVMEAMEKAATKLGLDQSVARQLVAQTAKGAAEMVVQGISSPELLRKQVTSPGGTTEAAIGILLNSNLVETFDEAITAACNRSIELSKT